MMKIYIPVVRFILSVIFLLLVFPGFSAGNRIKNPSFEQIGADNIPAEWSGAGYYIDPDITEFASDESAAHTGKASAVIINQKPNHSYLIQEIAVEELSIYKFSAWIKTENVDGNDKGASISINDKGLSAGNFSGTMGKWEYAELYVSTGRQVSSLTVVLNLGFFANECTGKAWFDDIGFSKVKELPVSAEVTVIDPITEKVRQEESTEFISADENPLQKIFILVLIGSVVVLGAVLVRFLVFRLKKAGSKADNGKRPAS